MSCIGRCIRRGDNQGDIDSPQRLIYHLSSRGFSDKEENNEHYSRVLGSSQTAPLRFERRPILCTQSMLFNGAAEQCDWF